MTALPRRSVAAGVGLLADRLLGEPPLRPHPVSLFGRLMRGVERHWYADSRARGVVHAAAGTSIGASAGSLLGATSVATYLAVAGRALGDAAGAVQRALDAGDLAHARELLPALVGRDPNGLDEKEVARATVESVAENTVDAIVAPALWAAALGPAGVLAYRAVNTMDATVGHRSERYERYGWASARLDDVAAWIPARVTALLVAAVRPRSAAAVVRVVRRDAPAHPSPNAGLAEAAFAGALGLRLGGENRYDDRLEMRPPLGDGRPPEAADIGAAVALSRDVTMTLAALMIGGGGVGTWRQTRLPRPGGRSEVRR